MLKLSNLTHLLASKITECFDEEVRLLGLQQRVWTRTEAYTDFALLLLPVSVYSLMIVGGQALDLAFVVVCKDFFDKLCSVLGGTTELIRKFKIMEHSLQRIDKYLQTAKLQAIPFDDVSGIAVRISGEFSWDGQASLDMREMLEIKKEEFVCIVGEVGSGKSRLLSAMQGEMNSENGIV